MVFSKYRNGRLSTVDTIDLSGILAVLIGLMFSTDGVSEFYGYDLMEHSWEIGAVEATLPAILVGSGFVVIVVTNGLHREAGDFMDVSTMEGVVGVGAIGLTAVVFVQPEFFVDYATVEYSTAGAVTTTAIGTAKASVLATQ